MSKTNAELLISAHDTAHRLYTATGNVHLLEQQIVEFNASSQEDADFPQWLQFVTKSIVELKQLSAQPTASATAAAQAAKAAAAQAAKPAPINTVPVAAPVVPAPAP